MTSEVKAAFDAILNAAVAADGRRRSATRLCADLGLDTSAVARARKGVVQAGPMRALLDRCPGDLRRDLEDGWRKSLRETGEARRSGFAARQAEKAAGAQQRSVEFKTCDRALR